MSDTAGANNGMHDVLLAAKWLQREAANLGADPSRLATFGESSGVILNFFLNLGLILI